MQKIKEFTSNREVQDNFGSLENYLEACKANDEINRVLAVTSKHGGKQYVAVRNPFVTGPLFQGRKIPTDPILCVEEVYQSEKSKELCETITGNVMTLLERQLNELEEAIPDLGREISRERGRDVYTPESAFASTQAWMRYFGELSSSWSHRTQIQFGGFSRDLARVADELFRTYEWSIEAQLSFEDVMAGPERLIATIGPKQRILVRDLWFKLNSLRNLLSSVKHASLRIIAEGKVEIFVHIDEPNPESNKQEIFMGNKNEINIGDGANANIVQAGRDAHSSHQQISAMPPELESLNLDELKSELFKLRQALIAQMEEDNQEHEIESEAVGEAYKAAKDGDRKGVWEKLKGVGGWSLGVAKDIGVAIVAEIIKKQLDPSK